MAENFFEAGNRGLLFLMKERFLVTLLAVDEATLTVTFPTRDIPAEGMYAVLEFHDPKGYSRYETEVLKTPEGVGDGLVLRRPFEMTRTHHRASWRVPADFDAQVKSHVHPRRHTCPVINVSLGGMLVSASAVFENGETADVRFALPDAGGFENAARVAHVLTASGEGAEDRLYGLEFIQPAPALVEALSHFVARRVRERFPGSMRG